MKKGEKIGVYVIIEFPKLWEVETLKEGESGGI
jgi:hypothetical protein